MGSSIWDWSTTAADNDDIDSAISWSNSMSPDFVDDSARAMMGRTAELLGDIGGALTAGGTANAITVTANSSFTSYSTGMIVAFTAASDNTGATTLSVNSIGTKSIRAQGDKALVGGEIKKDCPYVCIYNSGLNSDAGGWALLNPVISSIDNSSGSVSTGTLTTSGNASIGGTATVTGNATFNGNVEGKGAVVRAYYTDDTRYGYFEVLTKSGTTGALFGFGDGVNKNVEIRAGTDTNLNIVGFVNQYIDGTQIWHAGNFDKGDLATKDQASLTADVTGTLPVANGGTGATTVSAARTALGLGSLATKSSVALGSDVTGTLGSAHLSGTYAISISGNAATASNAIGAGQTWQDVSASRTGGTTYQNTETVPIEVAITGRNSDNPEIAVQVSSNGSSWIKVGTLPGSGSQSNGASFIVPANWYYRVNGTMGSGYTWAELR